mmetsp:Transcript_70713/g.207079  ORF Transcript_70713/g.207079 Transcript_70713/m.207079 type:complete len:490 (-) Transcript_70713:52-1521(-)
MKANPELQEKLQKRLSLQNESPSTPRAAASPTSIMGLGLPSPLASSLRERLNDLTEEREKVLERRRRKEDEEVHRSIELSSEVARLRVDVEVMRRDLETARREVQELRVRAERDRHHDQHMAEQAVHQDLQLAVAEARVEDLCSKVACNVEERSQLEEHVMKLEEEVAGHVVSRVRLEALLRKSEVREAEMKKLLSAAAAPKRPSVAEPVRTFTMDDDDEEEAQAQSDADGDGADGAQYMDDDLEYSYEVAQLAGTMSLERALQLARTGSLWPGAGAGAERPEAGEAEGAGGGPEDAYEAPLRELELALARIRGGAGSGGADDAEAACGHGSGAGTGEAVDNLEVFDQNLGLLQEVLDRLKPLANGEGAGREEELPPAPELPLQKPAQKPAEEAVVREEPPPPKPEAPRPAEPAQRDEEAPQTPERTPVIEERREAPAPELAAREEAGEARGEEGPRGGAPLPQAPFVGFGLFSPYARLGHKYAASLGK